jgi:hypothetical protein
MLGQKRGQAFTFEFFPSPKGSALSVRISSLGSRPGVLARSQRPDGHSHIPRSVAVSPAIGALTGSLIAALFLKIRHVRKIS